MVPNCGVPSHAWSIMLHATAPESVALQCHGALYNGRSIVLHAATPDCEALQCCRAPCQSLGHCAMTGTPCSVPQIPNVGHCSAVRHPAMPRAPWLSNVGHCNGTGLLLCSGPLYCSHALGLCASPWGTRQCHGAPCQSVGHYQVLTIPGRTSKVPALSRVTWSCWESAWKPGMCLANSTTSRTAGVKLREKSSQISCTERPLRPGTWLFIGHACG